ncbi:MAG: hypothetical protein WCH39_12785 [Schlesneria sp.]
MNQAVASTDLTRPQGVWPVAIVAFLSWFSIVCCVDPAGSYPSMPEGPGLTVDEIFNVEQGVYLVEQSKALGWLNLIPGSSQEAYRKQNGYNPDHPPLGRWWLGVHHHLTWWLAPPLDPEGYCVTACARTGSATAFALTVFLIGCLANSWSGRSTGVLTAISLVLMPRVYGHAHLASLETITNLTCTAAVLSVAAWWNGPVLLTRRAAMFAGVLMGLALLTKIQAVLIPIPVIVWTFWRWREKAFVPLVIWGLTACLVFFASWPYLWFDPLEKTAEYLGRTTNRATIQVWYWGQKYVDKIVPWHYPLMMFALTVPVVLHGLGLLGLFYGSKGNIGYSDKSHADQTTNNELVLSNLQPLTEVPAQRGANRNAISRDLLLLVCMLFPLIVFSLPGVAVYDGERLFLTCFPLWAIFVGRGWSVCWRWLSCRIRSQPTALAVWSALLLLAASPLVTMSPCHLCYYNGFAKLIMIADGNDKRFEVDYWGVGITRSLLQQLVKEVPAGSSVAILPTLHQFQAADYRRQSPLLRAHGIKTVEYRPSPDGPDFMLIYRRLADLSAPWNNVNRVETDRTTSREGRILAFFLPDKE